MYLSKVSLDLWSGESLAVFTDFYRAHAFVASACSQTKGPGRPLFRIEQQGSSVWLLAQSPATPNWDAAAHEHSVQLSAAEVKEYDPLQVLEEGRKIRFRLRANPTKSVKDSENQRPAKQAPNKPNRLRNVRVPLIREEEQVWWLRSRSERLGIELVRVLAKDEGVVMKGGRNRRRRKDTIQLYSVLYDGEAVVKEVTKLANAIAGGVGPAKGFGFGLLSVAPV